MKLDKLAKQLRRDLAANPKKAAALGLMALVALYFWAPLAWGWISPQGGKKSAQPLALILTDDPEQPTQAAKRRASQFRWEKVRQLVAADARMASAALDRSWLDPFTPQSPPPEAAAAPTGIGAAPITAKSDLTPDQAGIVLSGVLVGGKRRMATINGETYGEGSTIKIAKEGLFSAVEFRLARITRRGVELERNGKTYPLLLDEPELAHGDQINRAAPHE